jgi:hypothetical protein
MMNRKKYFREKRKYFEKKFREQKYFARMNVPGDVFICFIFNFPLYCEITIIRTSKISLPDAPEQNSIFKFFHIIYPRMNGENYSHITRGFDLANFIRMCRIFLHRVP